MDSSTSEDSGVEMTQMAGNGSGSLERSDSTLIDEKHKVRRAQNPILRARNKIWIFLDVPTSSYPVRKLFLILLIQKKLTINNYRHFFGED